MAMRSGRGGLVALVIYDSKMYYPGGVAYKWGNRVMRNFTRYAIEEAPARSGELRRGIYGDMRRVGVREMEVVIGSSAPHTMYVLGGTTGPIMSRRLYGFFNAYPHLYGPRGSFVTGNPVIGGRQDLRWMHAHGYAMRLRPGKGFPAKIARTVSGQEPNNFFGRAATRAAARHSSLRGFSPRYATAHNYLGR